MTKRFKEYDNFVTEELLVGFHDEIINREMMQDIQHYLRRYFEQYKMVELEHLDFKLYPTERGSVEVIAGNIYTLACIVGAEKYMSGPKFNEYNSFTLSEVEYRVTQSDQGHVENWIIPPVEGRKIEIKIP